MPQYKVGVTELEFHLSSYLKRAQQGDIIIITLRGKPIAQLESSKEALMNRVNILQEAELILWNGKKLKPAKPVVVNKSGKLMSDIIVDMRNKSY